MLQAILILLLLVPSAGLAYSTSCQDRLREYKKAQEYGATNFTCKDEYDGRVTSSWIMSPENYIIYREALTKSKRRKSK